MFSLNSTNLCSASVGIQLHTELNSIFIINKLHGLTDRGHAHAAFYTAVFPRYHMKCNLNSSWTNFLLRRFYKKGSRIYFILIELLLFIRIKKYYNAFFY